MTRQIAADALLAVAVLIVAASALGVLFMPGPFAKLHYVTPAVVVAPVFVVAALLVQEGLDQNAGETVLALFFLVAASPFLSHATIRAIRIRERGDWQLTRGKPHRAPDKAKERTP